MGWQTVGDGDAISPTLWNEQVRDQVVSVVASTGTIDTPVEGQMCYVTAGADQYKLMIYGGTGPSWQTVFTAT